MRRSCDGFPARTLVTAFVLAGGLFAGGAATLAASPPGRGDPAAPARTATAAAIPAHADQTTPVPLPPVLNELQRGTVDACYSLTRQLALGMAYWYDKYDVNDFALGPRDLASPATGTPSMLMFGHAYRPYTANTLSAWITYLWQARGKRVSRNSVAHRA